MLHLYVYFIKDIVIYASQLYQNLYPPEQLVSLSKNR